MSEGFKVAMNWGNPGMAPFLDPTTGTAAAKFFHGPKCDLARLWRRV